MPQELQDCMHLLMCIMWATAVTPSSWKTSRTTLLEKGHDPTLVHKKRPVGLLPCILKLYTRLVTAASTDYAEKHFLLSTSQKGFRRKASTMDQLQLLIMALEDARLTGQNIYKIQVDFTDPSTPSTMISSWSSCTT